MEWYELLKNDGPLWAFFATGIGVLVYLTRKYVPRVFDKHVELIDTLIAKVNTTGDRVELIHINDRHHRQNMCDALEPLTQVMLAIAPEDKRDEVSGHMTELRRIFRQRQEPGEN